MSRPSRTPRLRPSVVAALMCGVAAAAPAQDAELEPPSVLVESAGGDRIVEDFIQVLDLAGEQGQSQKRGLLDLLNGFLVGCGPLRPDPAGAADRNESDAVPGVRPRVRPPKVGEG